jgi:hypothetical protein
VATPQGVQHVIRCVGPMEYLRGVPYEQEHKFPEDPDDVTSALETQTTTRVILARSPSTGASVFLRNQVADALDCAIAGGAPITYSTTNLPTQQTPEDQALDLRCADVIARMLRWAPHIGCRWDYQGAGAPKLRFGNTTATSISGDGFGFQTRTIVGVAEFSGELRNDLLCPEFEICYIYENRATADGQTVKWRTIHRDISTVANGGFGRNVSTVVLRGAIFDGAEWGSAEPKPPDGLAALLHKAWSVPFFEMSWTERDQDVNWDYIVGEQWDVSGVAASAFADAKSVCQQIVRDIGAGTTSLTCGPATFLGLSDRLALLIPNRTRNQSRAAGESQYGFEAPDEDADEGEATTAIQVAKQESDGTWSVKYLLVDPTNLVDEPPTP